MSGSVDPSAGPASDPDCRAPGRPWLLPWLVVGAVAAVVVALFALAWVGIVPTPGDGAPYPPFWLVFPVGFLLFWLLVVTVARPRWGHGGWGGGYYRSPDAEELVRIRYARGEISRDQLTAMLRDLRDPGTPSGGDRLR
jgi:uncharacterized membrane protein